MGSRSRYLYQVGHLYYFRIKIPKRLTAHSSRRQIRKSLRTSDLIIASTRAKILSSMMSMVFWQMEEGMLSIEKMETLVDESISNMLVRHEQGLASSPTDMSSVMPGVEQQASKSLQYWETQLEMLKLHLASNNTMTAGDFLIWCAEKKGCEELDDDAELRQNAGRLYLKKMIRAIEKVIIPREMGDYSNEYDNVSLSSTNTNTVEATVTAVHSEDSSADISSRTVASLVDEFIKEKKAKGDWNKNSWTSLNAHFELFKEWLGNRCVSEVIRPDIVSYLQDVLFKLPKRRKINVILKKMTLEEQLADTRFDKIGIKSVKEYLASVTSFFNWCVDGDIIKRNPASNLSPKDNRPQSAKKLPYRNKEIEHIVVELSKLSKTNVNGLKNRDNTWITLISLFSGARENEICQIFTRQIVLCDGVPCFHFTKEEGSGQSIKNMTSYRTVPIHDTLLKLGFIDYVNLRQKEYNSALRNNSLSEEQITKQEQLFQFMTCSKSRDSYIKNFLNFYTKFKRKISNSELKTFHSIRHSFASNLMNSALVPYLVSDLAGHSHKTETANTYTHTDLKALRKEINRVDYGFDLFEIFGTPPLSDEEIAEQVQQLPVIGEDELY